MSSLNEATKSDLLNKSKSGKGYKSKNGNRFLRRTKSRIAGTVKSYNDIKMGKLFGDDKNRKNGDVDILEVTIPVNGETKDYEVGVSFNGVVEKMAEQLKGKTEDDFTFRVVINALKQCFQRNDIFVYCSCPDFTYRFQYWAEKERGDYLLGANLPAEFDKMEVTNPDNNMGAGCKHICLVLSNVSWVNKVASAINNYVHYIKDHMHKKYEYIIFPALYGMSYKDYLKMMEEQEYQNEDKILKSDKEEIDTSNEYGRNRTKFKVGNKEGMRFG